MDRRFHLKFALSILVVSGALAGCSLDTVPKTDMCGNGESDKVYKVLSYQPGDANSIKEVPEAFGVCSTENRHCIRKNDKGEALDPQFCSYCENYGELYCGDSCINVLKDAKNCGQCGNKCESYETCESGECLGREKGDDCTENKECRSGYCKNEICAMVALGGDCKRNDDCKSGICDPDINKCTSQLGLKADGATCAQPSECISQKCEGGKCSPISVTDPDYCEATEECANRSDGKIVCDTSAHRCVVSIDPDPVDPEDYCNGEADCANRSDGKTSCDCTNEDKCVCVDVCSSNDECLDRYGSGYLCEKSKCVLKFDHCNDSICAENYTKYQICSDTIQCIECYDGVGNIDCYLTQGSGYACVKQQCTKVLDACDNDVKCQELYGVDFICGSENKCVVQNPCHQNHETCLNRHGSGYVCDERYDGCVIGFEQCDDLMCKSLYGSEYICSNGVTCEKRGVSCNTNRECYNLLGSGYSCEAGHCEKTYGSCPNHKFCEDLYNDKNAVCTITGVCSSVNEVLCRNKPDNYCSTTFGDAFGCLPLPNREPECSAFYDSLLETVGAPEPFSVNIGKQISFGYTLEHICGEKLGKVEVILDSSENIEDPCIEVTISNNNRNIGSGLYLTDDLGRISGTLVAKKSGCTAVLSMSVANKPDIMVTSTIRVEE